MRSTRSRAEAIEAVYAAAKDFKDELDRHRGDFDSWAVLTKISALWKAIDEVPPRAVSVTPSPAQRARPAAKPLLARKPKPKSCNRHRDCDAADHEARKNGQRQYADHCHDDCCEECFGY